MKRLLAVFILGGLVAATAMAQQPAGTKSKTVSHGDAAGSTQTGKTNGTVQSTKDTKKTKKKSKKTKSQKTAPATPQ